MNDDPIGITAPARGQTPSGGSSGNQEAPRRACDECRRMKIRCINKENPPCDRCRSMKLHCSFTATVVAVRGSGGEPAEVFVKATNSRLEALEDNVAGVRHDLKDISSVLQRLTAALLPAAPLPAGIAESLLVAESSPQSITSLPAHLYSAHPPRSVVFARSEPTMPDRPPSLGTTPRTPFAAGSGLGMTGDAAEGGGGDDHSSTTDPLELAMTSEPFRQLTRLEEDGRLAADGNAGNERVGEKRKRGSAAAGMDEGDAHDTNLGPLPIRKRGDAIVNEKDPVTMGYCSEDEGRQLFDAFFQYAHPFLPILDPLVDTWESVRRRSPFIVTVIIWVAMRARDGCRQQSDTTQRCQDLAEMMARLTLFSPIATLETVQGLTLLTAWGEHGWRTCCHAMALAVDMRLFHCLQYLHKSLKSAKRLDLRSERQQQVMAGARLWLALVKQSYEMSYNHSLPVQFPADQERTPFKRELFEHPLSNLYDSRLVVSCEILEARAPAFSPYSSAGAASRKDVSSALRLVNKDMDDVYSYWLDYYQSIGLPSDHFLVNELGSQKAYSTVFANSIAWYGVRNKNDVVLLSAERREWIASAMRSAAYALSSIGGGKQQKDSEWGNHNFHVAIVATSLYLIRMIELLPDVCNVYDVSLDLDKLLLKLPDYPKHPFADILSTTVAKSRRHGVLPLTMLSDEAARVNPPALSQEHTASPLDLSELLPIAPALPWMSEQLVTPEDSGSLQNALATTIWPMDNELWSLLSAP